MILGQNDVEAGTQYLLREACLSPRKKVKVPELAFEAFEPYHEARTPLPLIIAGMTDIIHERQTPGQWPRIRMNGVCDAAQSAAACHV